MGTSVLIGIAAVIIVIAFAGVLGIIFFSTEAGSRARRLATGERIRKPLAFDDSRVVGLELRLSAILTLTQGPVGSLTLTLEEDMLPHLVARPEAGGVLVIAYEPPPGVVVLEPRQMPEVTLCLPQISVARISGETQAHFAGLRVDALDITLSWAAALSVEGLQAGSVSLHQTGRSRAQVTGQAAELRLNASGMVACDAAQLQAEVVTAVLDGMAEATVWSRAALEATLNGSARLQYYGDPQIHEHRTGKGMLLRRGAAPG